MRCASGAVDYVIADRKDLDDLMPPQPPKGEADALPYQDLRYLAQLDRSEGVAYLAHHTGFSRALEHRSP